MPHPSRRTTPFPKATRSLAWLLIALTAGTALPGRWTALGGRAEAAEPASPAEADRACRDGGATARAPRTDATPRPGAIRPGDRIRLSFYEALQSQDDKWGADRQRQEPARSFQLRAEMSNDYPVREDGTISLPLMGVFSVEGALSVEIQQQLGCAYDGFFGRKGFVNVLAVVRQPIYVVGQFKKPGSYEFAPGMTVLHAVSLAGGFDREAINPWQVADMTRETERLQLALDRAMRLVAHTVALDASRRAGPVGVPEELTALAGKTKAEDLLREELAPRRLEVQAAAAERKALQATVDSARAELELRRKRLPLLDQAIALRRDRLASLSKLADNGQLARPVIMQAQGDLLEAEDRRQETATLLALVQDRLAKAEQDLATRDTQATLTRRRDFLDTQVEASKAATESESAINVVKAMARTQLEQPSAEISEFVIVRRHAAGVSMIQASETTLLEPGDLVQARSRTLPSVDLRADQSNPRN